MLKSMTFRSTLAAVACAISMSVHAIADTPKQINVPAGALITALESLAKQAEVELVYQPEQLRSFQTKGVNGTYEPKDAVRLLLKGTPLELHTDPTGAMVIANPAAPTKLKGKESGGNDKQGTQSKSYWDRFRVAQADQAPTSRPPAVGDSASNSLDSTRVEEIVVTAQKREERLQDVPLSISALSADVLQRSGAETLADIARSVPGLNVVSIAPGNNQLVIRGICCGHTAGFYLDDTPIASVAGGMDPALFDLDRVEVLRGPQGTLYGESSMGGTVKYITHRPDLNLSEGAIDAQFSDTDTGGFNYQVSGVLNQPIVAGDVALRVAAFYRNNDGYIDRYPIASNDILAAGPGPVATNVNTEKTYGTRIGIEYKPNDNWSFVPAVFLQQMNLGGAFTFDSPPGSFDNPIQARDTSEPNTDKFHLYTLTINGDIQPNIHVTSSTSYGTREFANTEDDSKVPYFFFSPDSQSVVYPTPFYNSFTDRDFTEEARISAGWGRFHGLLGLFYYRQDQRINTDFPIPAGYNAAFGTPFGDLPFYAETYSNPTIQRAAFTEVNIDITSELQATVGLRAFNITQSRQLTTGGVFNGGSTTTTDGSTRDTGTTPKFELSYHFTPDMLAYLLANKGFRQGSTGVVLPSNCDNDLAKLGIAPGTSLSYKADSLWNYELGAKTSWLDHRLTLNGTLYYINWSNVQQLVVLPDCGYSFTGNFGKASSKGAELEIQSEPIPGLRLTLGGAYNDAKLTATVPGAQGQEGQTLQNAPHWQGSGSADYQHKIRADLAGYVRADVSTVSYQYNNFDTTSIYNKSAGWSLVNLRIGARRGSFDGALFADNLLNKRAETALPLSYAYDLPNTRRISLNRPRTIGLELRFGW